MPRSQAKAQADSVHAPHHSRGPAGEGEGAPFVGFGRYVPLNAAPVSTDPKRQARPCSFI